MTKSQQIRELVGKIMYQMASGIHTYSYCCSPGCDTRSRGGGMCESCLTEELGKLVGIEKARKFYFAQEARNAAHDALLEGGEDE